MRNEPMRRNDLPETCFSILPSSGQLIIIKKGESGYYPSEWDTGSREENREIASSHNARRSITDIQEAAMLAGSMFGWNTPGANPQWYLDNARYVNSNIVQGHIKDPIMSVYYPVSSFLLRYEIMGKQHFYLPILPLFEDDLNEIVDYISVRLQNPIAAEDFVDAVENAIQDRLSCAEAFEPYHSAKERRYPYYRIQVKNYTIFYVVIGDTIEVRRIVYSRRDLSKQI